MTDVSSDTPFGVVDMGSNGIRFGIVRALARHLPVAYEERAPISLFEAQGEDRCIPAETVEHVITSFRRFKKLCEHAGVASHNVRVIATEAMRVASNAEEFMKRIYDATGWTVSLLSKEEEASISASGILGSFYRVNGLTMDLGGGSVEFGYVVNRDGVNKFAENPVSLPYGAAAVKRLLAKCQTDQERQALYQRIVADIQAAINIVQIPENLKNDDDGGYTVYMSGGGFRALGYLSMTQKGPKLRSGEPTPSYSSSSSSSSSYDERSLPKNQDRQFSAYPIPIINGYSISGKELCALAEQYKDTDPGKATKKLRCFRVSERRAHMIPAICFLVSAMLQVIKIRCVHFSEGGVRQGLCYRLLSAEEQAKDPLLEGVKAYVAESPAHALSQGEYDAIYAILAEAIPGPYMNDDHPLQLHRLLPAAIYLANLTSHYPKETRAFVAFHMPLASGPLANVPGVSHQERAALALLLAFRRGGEVPDPIFRTIQRMVGSQGTAVCKYVGRLMELIFTISPLQPAVGLLQSGISFSASVLQDDDPKSENVHYYPRVKLCIRMSQSRYNPMVEAPAVASVIESLDENINLKKFEMDEDERSIMSNPKLFSVNIVYQ